MNTLRVRRYAGLHIFGCCLFIASVTFGVYIFIPARFHHHITERYTISDLGERSNVYLGVLIPFTGPYQIVDTVQIDWSGDVSREVRESGEEIKLEAMDYPGKSITAEISYDVILIRGNINWDAPVEETHTGSQYGIESDHPELSAKASQITNGKTIGDVRNIYYFVADNIEYQPLRDNWALSTAVVTYKSKSGICTGIARLMVAMCRAINIPAQVVHGIIVPDMFMGGELESGNAHAWVEFYAENQWGIADPTWGSGIYGILHFNHSDGLHLSYGEFDQERWDIMDMAYWAVSSADFIAMENGFNKYVASSTAESASIEVVKTIRKGWDSRWVIVLLTWGIATWLTIWYRNRFLVPSAGGRTYVENEKPNIPRSKIVASSAAHSRTNLPINRDKCTFSQTHIVV
jgi:transglutaminase-like putative cysteine protease